MVAVAQVVRASGCGPEGRGFESPQSPHARFRLRRQSRRSRSCDDRAQRALECRSRRTCSRSLRAPRRSTRCLATSSESTSSAPYRAFNGRSGRRQHRRPVQHLPSVRVNSALVAGFGRDEVDRARRPTSWSIACTIGADVVVERDPAHPLLARTEAAAEPELEREQHPLERAAVRGEHDAGADGHTADPGVGRRRRLRLPRDARPRRGSRRRARSASVSALVAAVAVVADRRTRHEHLRLGCSQLAIAPASTAVPRMRLSRMRCFCSSVQRLSPMPSPARCTTASTPSSAGASMRPASGSHRMSSSPVRRAAHEAQHAMPVGAAGAAMSAVPMSPLAPLIATSTVAALRSTLRTAPRPVR